MPGRRDLEAAEHALIDAQMLPALGFWLIAVRRANRVGSVGLRDQVLAILQQDGQQLVRFERDADDLISGRLKSPLKRTWILATGETG
jgi:hypothetical protein